MRDSFFERLDMQNLSERREGWAPQSEDARDAYDVDYARVIHSASFRRLQGKTQILNLGDSDFYRTRLTHSLEVGQVSTSIVRQLRKNFARHPCQAILPSTSLIQSICFTHDLGHPPFGHGGEVALNYCMRDSGGFEGNGQTLRILSRLEKFSKNAGANLTRRMLLGILKYPIAYSVARNPKLSPRLLNSSIVRMLDRDASKPPKSYLDSEQDVVDWLLDGFVGGDKYLFTKTDIPDFSKHKKALHKSFDCSIMDVADDIGYGVHDLEDAIALGLVIEDDFVAGVPDEVCAPFLESLRKKYPDEFSNDVHGQFARKLFSDGGGRKRQISRMVHHFITSVEPYEEKGFQAEIFRYRVRIRDSNKKFLSALQKFVLDKVIRSASVQHLEFKGQHMVLSVFDAISGEPKSLLPADWHRRFSENGDPRVICDYIAGMTDYYLLRTYERLFSPRMGSVFDRL